ncbi:hypothetical protein PspLS_08432 [Pyricularia sp. CBS 133598]|nr:hypothetical protein PspLS_08432 [Pyricularia sp. CBS 133598]
MPMFALPGILGGLSLAIKITGELYECFVINGGCRMADLPMDNNYKVEDLAASVIPALNETVMMRAESEGLLATAAANTGPCGVPQYNFDMCSADVRHVTVRTSLPAAGVARFDNVPPTCMVLSTVLGGGCGVAPPYPLVCGSACLQYTGLSRGQLTQLGNSLRGRVVRG